jgi:hypothetical protein
MTYDKIKRLHDAHILGISISDNGKEFEVLLRTSEGSKGKLIFEDLQFLRVVDFCQTQNIISRAIIYQGDQIDFDVVRERLMWVTSTTLTGSYLKEDKLKELCSGIADKRYLLFYVEPSVGAELVAVCGSVRETD